MKKTIIITGATSGFGELFTRKFLSSGNLVIATGRKLTERTEIFAKEREEFSNQLIEIDLDVTSEQDCLRFKSYLEKMNYKIDILINNAGHGLFGSLEDLELEEIRHQFEVNFFGLILITKMTIPFMKSGSGKIFNFSSVFGFVGFPLSSAYCASKHAVEGLSESLDYELRPHGIQVCLIEPGAFRTRFSSSSIWPKKISDKYSAQTRNYQNLRNRLMSRDKFQDPRDLVDVVYRLSLRTNLPARVVCGKDATFTYYVKKIMPSFFYHFLSNKLFSKFFR